MHKVVVIGGPTGVGKSEFASLLARLLNGELISCDSVQVYQHVSIGANKTAANAPIREHLLDLVPLGEAFTAADYYEQVVPCIKGVWERERIPIVVGGTGFYLEWLLHGRPTAPETDPAALGRVEERIAELEWPEALKILSEIDPVYAQSLLPNDRYRLKRALAVAESTGCPLSSFTGRIAHPAFHGLDIDFRCLFLTAEREQVCRNIDGRCEEMIERGLIEEVCDLVNRFGLQRDSQVGRSIGYNETLAFLERVRSESCCIKSEFMHFLDDFKAATRQYSRKQENWFSTRPEFKFISRAVPFGPLDELAERVAGLIKADRDLFEESLREGDDKGRQLRSAKAVQQRMKTYRPHETRFKGPALDSIIQRILKLIK